MDVNKTCHYAGTWPDTMVDSTNVMFTSTLIGSRSDLLD